MKKVSLTPEQMEAIKKILIRYTAQKLDDGALSQFEADKATPDEMEFMETGLGEMGEISDTVDELINEIFETN